MYLRTLSSVCSFILCTSLRSLERLFCISPVPENVLETADAMALVGTPPPLFSPFCLMLTRYGEPPWNENC